MEINQTSVAFAGTAAVAPQQQQETQKAVQEERDDVQRSTANTAAATSTDVADVRPDVPDDTSEAETHRTAVESDPPADSSSERERPRGEHVDLKV